MNFHGFVLITLLAYGGALAEKDDTVYTIDHYIALTLGMSYNEVVEVMGDDGTEDETTVNTDHIIYIWENPDGSHISVGFKEGALDYKTWGGLYIEPGRNIPHL